MIQFAIIYIKYKKKIQEGILCIKFLEQFRIVGSMPGILAKVCQAARMLSCFSCIRLVVTLWTVARQAPLSMGFSRPEYWSGLLFSSPGDLHYPWTELTSLMSPALAGVFFTTGATWEAIWVQILAPLHMDGETLRKFLFFFNSFYLFNEFIWS